MTGGQETSRELINTKLNNALSTIINSRIEVVSEIGRRAVEKINEKTLLIGFKKPPFSLPTLTSLDVLKRTGRQKEEYDPIIVLDREKVVGADDRKFQADLVRTLAIAVQFPDDGFQRPYRSVYGDAIDVQTEWLESTPTPPLGDFDPRVIDREELLKKLLGDARYYSDVGFDDWQRFIFELSGVTTSMRERSLLLQLRKSVEGFVVRRHQFLRRAHAGGVMEFGDEYLQQTQEERKHYVAGVLVNASLDAKPDGLS